MFVSAALCVSARGYLIFAKTMAVKWKNVVEEWKQWCKTQEEIRKQKEAEENQKKKEKEDNKKKKEKRKGKKGKTKQGKTQAQERTRKRRVLNNRKIHSIADDSSEDEPDSFVNEEAKKKDNEETDVPNVNKDTGSVLDNDEHLHCEPDIETQITSETMFDDDPVAYASIWDEGEREPYIDFLHLFETILCFNSWTRMDRIWESNPRSPVAREMAEKSVKSVQIMMDGIRLYAPRLDKKGKLMCNGWMIPKYHNLLHIIRQISNFGPVNIVDTEFEESNHKEIIKLNAKTVQKRGKGVFNSQLGDNIWQMQAWDILCKISGIGRHDVELLKNGQSPAKVVKKREKRQLQHYHREKESKSKGQGTTLKIFVVKNQVGDDNRNASIQYKCTYKYASKTSTGMTLPEVVLEYFTKHAGTFFTRMNTEGSDSLTIHGCTEVKFKDTDLGTIRSHPNFQSKGPWRDWVRAWIPRHQRTPFNVGVSRTILPQESEMVLVLGQVLCFVSTPMPHQEQDAQTILQSGEEENTSEACDHGSTSSKKYDDGVTHFLLRTTYCQNDKDKEKASVLFSRWRKAFGRSSRVPDLVLVPITNITKSLGVVDENPEMIDHRDKVPMYLHSNEEREILAEYNRGRVNYGDIVWEVRCAKEWAKEFNDSASTTLKARYTTGTTSASETTDRDTTDNGGTNSETTDTDNADSGGRSSSVS